MSTSKAGIMPNSSTIERERQANQFLRYKLKWRQQYLVVNLASTTRKMYLSGLDTQEWLVNRLKLSSLKGVCLDPNLGETEIEIWADACAQADKTAFLRLPPQLKRAKRQNLIGGKLQKLLDRAIAALLILLLSPALLALLCISCWRSPNPFTCDRQWYVSQQGKLFRLYKFQLIATANSKRRENDAQHESKNLLERYGCSQLEDLDRWLRRYHFDRLPKLFNALRGEIGIVERRYLTLGQVVRLSLDKKPLDKKPLLEARHQEPQSERSIEKLHSVGVEYKH
ncbi:heterocyst development glycosyltransferase HepC [Chroococcidiopsis sp.]|uniref:heterocyst development glycosyltransferase HepC n=1 Tax=Chroococcidiopsis sp. TaxID=3088168 RepID=UPI003F34352B